QAEDGIRDFHVTGVQTCALPIYGLKTAGLFGLMWAIVLGLWALFGARANLLWLFVGIGLVTTFYGYWNSDKIAIRAMHARPVSKLEQPAMYRIVRELSTQARLPMHRPYG